MVLIQDEVCSVPIMKLLKFFKTRVWEQKRWNRWDLVTQVEGMDGAWMDAWRLSPAAFYLALCHALRNFGKRSGFPEDPAKCGDPVRERGSEGRHRTRMRKKIHPRYRSSPSRHRNRMWMIDAWWFRNATDFDDGMRGGGVGCGGWRQ